MPELAEVAFFCRIWSVGFGDVIERVHLHAGKRVFRETDTAVLAAGLTGAVLAEGQAQAKQMCFRFADRGFLGVHLGMTGRLRVEDAAFVPGPHDHLVLYQAKRALVFHDPRLFGQVRYDAGTEWPAYWRELPPPVLDPRFTVEAVEAFLKRRKGTALKPLLLMQERFPGIGNWMADEILWRARLRPQARAGDISFEQVQRLHASIREVAGDALAMIAGREGDALPHFMNERIPDDWLFNHRWKDGGTCPKTGKPLQRETIGGRTTCWSPAWQIEP